MNVEVESPSVKKAEVLSSGVCNSSLFVERTDREVYLGIISKISVNLTEYFGKLNLSWKDLCDQSTANSKISIFGNLLILHIEKKYLHENILNKFLTPSFG